MSWHIDILNGPNLNLLGQREPEIYGSDSLDDVAVRCRSLLPGNVTLDLRQSNHEGVLVDWIQAAREGTDGIIINPAALSHSSVAILDALNMFEGPVIEVHISNVHARESFRHHSFASHRSDAMIAGFGVSGYLAATRHMLTLLGAADQPSSS